MHCNPAPDQRTWSGRRDHALILLAVQSRPNPVFDPGQSLDQTVRDSDSGHSVVTSVGGCGPTHDI
jgi:hypothetical protein